MSISNDKIFQLGRLGYWPGPFILRLNDLSEKKNLKYSDQETNACH